MEATARARFVRVTPTKARRVVDLVRGQQATAAVDTLRFAPQSAAEPVRKVLESAIANARDQADQLGERFEPGELLVSEAYVDEGPTMKRFRPRAQGRAYRIRKRTSHITVVVSAPEPELELAEAGGPGAGAAARGTRTTGTRTSTRRSR